jgi:virginiamycin B lyase
MRPRLLAALSVAAVAPAVRAQPAAEPVPTKEWAVPWENTRPRDPMIDGKGRVWFVGQEGNYVAYLEPGSGKFRRYEIDPGTNPHSVIVDRAGHAWYTGNRNAMIGKLDPETGKVTRFPMPDPAVRDPHTHQFAPNGDLWFTAQNANYVGRLTPATGKVQVVKMPTPNARPYGLGIDQRGHPWFDLFGTNKIGTIDPQTMRLREFPLPNDRARPRRIALTSDGTVWYVDYTRGFLGRLDPKTGAVKEWANPGGVASLPYAMTSDDQDRLWFVETGLKPNRLVGFDPKKGEFFGMTEIGGSGPNTVRHMTFDKASGQIWFGTDQGTIGRATVVRKPVS